MDTDQAVLTQVQALVPLIQAASERADWPQANTLLKQAFEQLGERYQSPDVIDETGMRLVLADAQERAGAWPAATSIRSRMLETRLQMLQRKLTGQ